MKHILVVLTSHEDLGDTDQKTRFQIEEFASPYYTLKDAGCKITLASPKGGLQPIDPKSDAPDQQTPSMVRFKEDKETQDHLSETIPLSEIDHNGQDAVFYPEGHGPLWDLATDKDSIQLIESFYENKKPVSAVCHAPAICKHTKQKNGRPLVQGKKITGFSNTEEEAVSLTDIVPFLVEDMLKENGGIYSKIDDWQPYAIQDGLLITGQNPASLEKVAKLLPQELQA